MKCRLYEECFKCNSLFSFRKKTTCTDGCNQTQFKFQGAVFFKSTFEQYPICLTHKNHEKQN